MNDHDGPPSDFDFALPAAGTRASAPPRPPLRRALRLLLLASALVALLAAAAAGWVNHRDREVIARYALDADGPADRGAAAVDLLLESCTRLPAAVRSGIVDSATLIHEEDTGDWSNGRREIKVYRHRYLDYYVDYTTGFFPVQHRFCRAG